jgi:hypothetical protein
LVVLVSISVRIVKSITQQRVTNWKEVPTKMGAELLKFAGTFSKDHYLKEFQCSRCQQPISEQDIEQKNYTLWVSDYANEVSKEEFVSAYSEQKLTAYGLNFWLKAVEHEDCSELKGEE